MLPRWTWPIYSGAVVIWVSGSNLVDWITLALVAAGLCGTFSQWAWRKWQSSRSFHMRIAEWSSKGFDDAPHDDIPVRRSLTVTTDSDTSGAVLVRLEIRSGQLITLLVRPQRRHWALTRRRPFVWRWEDDPDLQLDLFRNFSDESAPVPQWEFNSWEYSSLHYQKAVAAPPNVFPVSYCWFSLPFKTERKWSGYLAINGVLRHERGREHTVRCRLTVVVNKYL